MPEQNSDTTNNISPKESSWAMSPKDFIFKYLKYLPWVIGCGIVGFMLAYIKLRYMVPIYRVQSSLLIKDESDNGLDKDKRLNDLFMAQSNTNLSNETAILMSTPLLKRVAKDLNLQVYYYNQGNLRSGLFYPKTPIDFEFLQMADSNQSFSLAVNVLNDQQFTLNEDKTVYKFGQSFMLNGNKCLLSRINDVDWGGYIKPKLLINWRAPQEAAEDLVSKLKVVQASDQATILTLSFESESTTLGVNVLNTLMAVYDSIIIEDKTRMAINTEHFIDSRLISMKSDLGNIEGNVRSYMENNQTFDVEDQSKKYIESIAESEKGLIELRVRQKVADLLVDYIDGKENAYKLVPTNLGIEEPVLIQQVTEYNRLLLERETNLRTTTVDNPVIKGLETSIDKIRKNIREALQNVRNAYEVSAKGIEQAEDGIKDQLRTMPGKSMQMLNIQRQQKILEELYSFLLQKKIEASISSSAAISNSKVLEPARGSSNPISPDRKKTYTFYLLIGLILPVGVVAILEVLRDKVGGRADVEKRTNAPILGEIGHSDESKSSLVVTQNSRSIIAEQFRIIRTNLQFVSGGKKNISILVTSSFSGEGKSFISTNIGAVLALSGRKTVIMEFDIRKPKIVAGLDLKRKMGISNYIIGKASFNDLPVKVEGVDNLYVIPCGPIPPNPAEILLDQRLDELMRYVKENFEAVIMDTAPVGLVSDAVSLSRFADCTMFVVRQGYTFRKQVNFIEEFYAGKKLPALSILLNDVKQGGSYYGGYGYYGGGYGYGASSGYFENDFSKGKIKSPFKRLSNWWKQLFG